MNILMLSYEFTPIGGGGAKVVAGLTRELAKRGHHVDCVTMHYKGLKLYEEVDGVHVYRIPSFRLRQSICSAFEWDPSRWLMK